ncbi:hsp90-like protein [Plectosphaerella plurivora]|uniref:Hsp90-like protein n=1 Tax=Plectosphaerella plurivora TaxID=936078 RepID=A0A9P8VGM5_9PEZI|nr:hsp90-like protein [Plectosphaerella plurivora]
MPLGNEKHRHRPLPLPSPAVAAIAAVPPVLSNSHTLAAAAVGPPAAAPAQATPPVATFGAALPASTPASCSQNSIALPNVDRTDFASSSFFALERALGEWPASESRYGLTSSALIPPAAGFSSHSQYLQPTTPATATTTSTASPETAFSRPSPLISKRHSDDEARTRLLPPRGLDLTGVPKGNTAAAAFALHMSQGVTSPLFFSNSLRPMSARTPRLPPSDAAAVLLARLHEDAESTHTVKLPRGNVHARSPARSGSTSAGSGSWSSTEPTATASSTRSPNSQPLPPGLQVLRGVGVIELLEQDERPTFIIDLVNPINSTRPGLHLMYANAALRASSGTLKLLAVEGEEAAKDVDYSGFKSWLLSCVKNNESMDVCLPSHNYGGITWTCSTLRRRFRFISASKSAVSEGSPEAPEALAKESVILEERSRGPTPSPHQADQAVEIVDEGDYFGELDPIPSAKDIPIPYEDVVMDDDDDERHHSDEFTNRVLHAGLLRPSFDWTRITITPDMNKHIHFARTIDWGATSLGPIEDWNADLRAMANMVMGSPHPAAMYWGHDLVTIYNEAYIEIAGQKHPALMGMRYQDAWSEIWADLGPVLHSAFDNGQSFLKNDNRLFVNRHGFLEEAFFSWSIVPLIGSDGQVVGLYNPAFENTRRKVNERRMLTLREVGEKTAAARDVRGFWPKVKQGLEFNEPDIPFALIYSVKDEAESEISSMHSGSVAHPPHLQLEGALGVPPESKSYVHSIDLRISDEGFAPYMRQSMSMHGVPVVLSAEDGTLPTGLLEGLDWGRGFGEATRTVVILPVHPTTGGESVVGFIVMGTNPRRPYDEDYKLFIHLLSRQLATSLASVVLFEEEIRRGQRAAKLAALDREELRTELILRTQEAVESEYKFTRMAEFAPVGMFIASGEGLINFANDTWWQISRHPRGEDSADGWMQSVRDEDRPGVERVWDQLLHQKEAITHEFRFKCSRQNGDHMIDTWVLMSAYPEKDEDGELKSIFGCITDISTQKWAEAFQMQRREEAMELKRQQENFIDITSHEMRNPLSAILQCADEICNNIHDYRDQQNGQLQTLLDSCLEASNTINLCASHQHRIVDDILTLSKLDSQLLLVTPVYARPVNIVQNVLKMFESEVNTHDIKLEFEIKPAYVEHGIDWVKLDPSRLRQVLINLMTNAIKFTQNREVRRIRLTLGASRSADIEDGSYFPSRRNNQHDLTSDKEWGDGVEMNLHFSVQDTGPGLQDDEKKLLFQRFSQTSPRTHVQYGGSGLGLFISRMLTELQGGQIGVVSEKGLGSTFSFYIKCRKADHPSDEVASMAELHAKRPTRPGRIPTTTTPPPSKHDVGSAGPTVAPPVPDALPTPPGHDVLIVEDNLVNQKVLQRQLRNCGNTTHVANHGGEALDALKKSRYWSGQEADGYHLSVILMDLEMPVMDGMTCAKRIRELEREGVLIRHIPIIAVTAYARPEQIQDAKDAGIDDVISKPFRIPDLTAKIDELISKWNNLRTAESP